MAVANIFSPECIEGQEETQEYISQVLEYLDTAGLQPKDCHAFIYSLALRQACEATLTGSRGVGCVITCPKKDVGGHEIVAEGQNRLADEDNDFEHVAHAEVLTIANMRKRNREARQSGKGEQFSSADVTLWSTLGPCAMCMLASINQRIRNVVTLAPDWTGGVTMDHIAQTYPGYAKYIKEYDLRSFDAPVDLISRADVAQNIRVLCWAVSRIKQFRFDREEFQMNEDLRLHDALHEEKVSVADLEKRLEIAMQRGGLVRDYPFVRSILHLMDQVRRNEDKNVPILMPWQPNMTTSEIDARMTLEWKVLMIINLIKQIPLGSGRI